MKKSIQMLLTLMFLNSIVFAATDSEVSKRFIEKYRELAISEMHRTGVPASVKLGQAILESNFGRSPLARKANNFFGVKCGGNWHGAKYYQKDDDYDKRGKLRNSCFRKYDRPKDSWIAHSEFLQKDRYASLFFLDIKDYKGWAKGLQYAGYATSPTYAEKLIGVIERYKLYQYDKLNTELPNDIIKDNSPVERDEKPITTENPITERPIDGAAIAEISTVNDVRVTYALSGETIMNIAERTGVSSNALMKYNELFPSSSTVLKRGTRVYLQMKRNANRDRKLWHKVQPGETMFDISQMYGIRLVKLYTRNLMEEGTQPSVGEQILLRGRRTDSPSLRGQSTTTTTENTDSDLDIPTPTPNFDPFEEEELEEEEGFFDDEFVLDLEDFETPEKEEIATTSTNVNTVPATTSIDDLDIEKELDNPISSTTKVTTTNVSNADYTYYVVKQQDTLYSIARSHGASVQQIKTWNQLSDNRIYPNQRLRVR